MSPSPSRALRAEELREGARQRGRSGVGTVSSCALDDLRSPDQLATSPSTRLSAVQRAQPVLSPCALDDLRRHPISPEVPPP